MSETTKITEIKYSPGHPTQSWECEVIDMSPPAWARIRYVSDQDYTIEQGVTLPAGTTTEGMYWNDRPYHIWRFTSPSGDVIGYRFDVCMNTHIWRSKLIWTDLGHDLWVPRGGGPIWQDEDEVQQLLRLEHLSPEEGQMAEDGKALLDREWKNVIEEVFGDRW